MTDAPSATVHEPRPNRWDFTPDAKSFGTDARRRRRFWRKCKVVAAFTFSAICLVLLAYGLAGVRL